MSSRRTALTLTLCLTTLFPACDSGRVDVRDRLAQYATVRLEADTTGLTRSDRLTLASLIAAAAEMDTLFWDQAYGAYGSLLASIRDPEVRRYAEMNYGPWAKFEKILVPMANLLIAEDQRSRITFDAFFQNVMFHEVAHGLGVKRTVTGKGTVREALKEHASALEEGKADVLGLYMVSQLRDRGALTDGAMEDNYVSSVASILRSIRFGATDAHGRANMVQFALLQELGAVTRDSASGTYRVNLERMPEAVRTVAERILTLQGDGEYEGAGRLLAEKGIIGPVLKGDLDRLSAAEIPVDVVFEQQGPGLPTAEAVSR